MTNPLQELARAGQSVWIDNLTRKMLSGGSLWKLIRDDGLSGVTSNPAIFQKAITGSDAYDDQVRLLADGKLEVPEIYDQLVLKDITGAADVLRGTWESSRGGDGYVSLEVSPHLARKTQETVDEAARLWRAVDRPNVLIKIPGTEEGLPAIEECLFRGVNVNITLLFSLERYEEVMEAYLRALERRRESGEPLDAVASVASFFLSRIDVKVDGLLDDGATEDAAAIETLRGNVAVASAKEAYRRWKAVFSGSRWDRLQEAGARVQKPLWASTSTKNPDYSDVRYVEPLVGRKTITTLPDETLDAFRDHGRVRPDAVEKDPEAARRVLDALEPVGLHLGRITDELVEEGIRKFCDPFDNLMEALDEKRQALV